MSAMMLAQCSICTELFDSSASISAVPCGHTFHDHCLARWLRESQTCPQCRQTCKRDRVIHRLYFDQSRGDLAEETDVCNVQNQLDETKARLRQRDSDLKEQRAENNRMGAAREHLQAALTAMESSYRTEKEATASLRKELRLQQQAQCDAEAAVAEAATLRNKLAEMKTISVIMEGEEDRVKEMISSQRDRKQLSMWCAILQQELANKRRDSRSSRQLVESLRRDATSNATELATAKSALVKAREQLSMSEHDLAESEKRVTSMQRKVSALERALGSPNGSAAQSFAHRLLHESPAPLPSPATVEGATPPLGKKPRLSSPDLNDTLPDLFPEMDKPAVQQPKEVSMKITSVATKAKRKADDTTSTMVNYGNFNLFKKKVPCDVNSVIRKGYNGMGGHGRFVQPVGKPPRTFKQSSVSATFAKLKKPPLPTMSGFLGPR